MMHIDPEHGYAPVYEVELPANSSSRQMSIQMCRVRSMLSNVPKP